MLCVVLTEPLFSCSPPLNLLPKPIGFALPKMCWENHIMSLSGLQVAGFSSDASVQTHAAWKALCELVSAYIFKAHLLPLLLWPPGRHLCRSTGTALSSASPICSCSCFFSGLVLGRLAPFHASSLRLNATSFERLFLRSLPEDTFRSMSTPVTP